MSDINIIMWSLRPWVGREGPVRYYVNDWKDLLKMDVVAYCKINGCPVDATRYGRVWYDEDARAHVNGVSDFGLSHFIERTMERTQFLTPFEVPRHEYDMYDWTKLSERVSRDFRGDADEDLLFPSKGVNVFHYKGRDFYVEHSYLMEQMKSNPFAYRHIESGTVWFECEASDLWEFVLELVNDEIKAEKERARAARLEPMPLISVIPEKKEPAPKKELPKPGPFVFLREMTESEKEQRYIEQIESESRPRTRWNKKDIIDNCREAKVPQKALKVLKKMNLDEILNRFLIYDDTNVTGNSYNYEQQRHTRFYRLDMDGIRALEPTLDTFRKRTESDHAPKASFIPLSEP